MSERKRKAHKFVLENMGILTQREFKAVKRSKLKELIKMWNKFRLGVAYVPDYPYNINEINKLLTQLKKTLSVKNWGH